MSYVLRINDLLAKNAESEAALMNRSTSKQVEFWAELGMLVSKNMLPDDMLALMQGIAEVRVEVPEVSPISADDVFSDVDSASESGKLGSDITRGRTYYEAAGRYGTVQKVLPDGSRIIGHFKNGEFIAE